MPDSSPAPLASKNEPDLSGRRLGDYQLLRRLGRGGMADVYLAEQVSLRRQVAFKVLKQSLAGDETYIRRFHHEARAAASLVHANIVQIYEVGCIEKIHFIAQEYVPGANLKQYLARHGPAGSNMAVRVMRQVAAALHKAGEQGIIHRDIKPENIMLASSGEVKVADFGLARVLNTSAETGLTQIGITMGTPLYMSPEQVEGRALDPRSDLYSFGVTCYQMLTGRAPFEGDTALAIAVQHLKRQPERLETARPDLPGNLCRLVHKMLAKAPGERQQSAAELLRELRGLHIEGEQWPTEMEEWDTPELLALANARLEATQQLDALMKATSSRRRRYGALLALVAFAAFGIGATAGWLNRSPSLLAVTEGSRPLVERQESVEQQYFHAYLLGSEDGWQAVWRYFPPDANAVNELYANRAKLRLAEWYFDNEQYDQAMQYFTELANLGSGDKELKAQGMIGQLNVHVRQSERPEAIRKLPQLKEHMATLDRDLQEELLEEWLDGSLRQPFDTLPSVTARPAETPFQARPDS